MADTKQIPVVLETIEHSNGYLYELTQHGPASFDVDCWTKDGDCHWNKWFNNLDAARKELHRWI